MFQRKINPQSQCQDPRTLLNLNRVSRCKLPRHAPVVPENLKTTTTTTLPQQLDNGSESRQTDNYTVPTQAFLQNRHLPPVSKSHMLMLLYKNPRCPTSFANNLPPSTSNLPPNHLPSHPNWQNIKARSGNKGRKISCDSTYKILSNLYFWAPG